MNAQTVGNGGIEFQRFAGDATTFFRAQCPDGAHIVGAVGQLNQDHPDILRHGHKHFLQVGNFKFLIVFELHLIQLTDTLHQLGHGITKALGQILFTEGGVFNHIMQQGGHQGFMIHPHISEDTGNGYRMRNVRFAA